MKKSVLIMRVLALALVFGFAFVSCDSFMHNEDPVIGTWEGKLDGAVYSFLFRSGGTGVLTVTGNISDVTSFTYTITFSTVYLKYSDGTEMGNGIVYGDRMDFSDQNARLLPLTKVR